MFVIIIILLGLSFKEQNVDKAEDESYTGQG